MLRRVLKRLVATTATAVCLSLIPGLAQSSSTTPDPSQVVGATVARLNAIFAPAPEAEPTTFTARLRIVQADGVAESAVGQEVKLAFQAPDKLRVEASIKGHDLVLGRHGQQLWIHAPGRHYGVVGKPGLLRFANNPASRDTTQLGPVTLPMKREQLMLLPLMLEVQWAEAAGQGPPNCFVLAARAKPEAVQALHLPKGRFTIWVDRADRLLRRVAYREGDKVHVELAIDDPRFESAWPASKWDLQPGDQDHVDEVALSHLSRFLEVAASILTEKVPPLGPATGARQLVATEGQGRLELWDGTRVLFLKGSPEEMGRQHGALLRKQIRDVAEHILYGVGVASSFEKGRWFFEEIDEALHRVRPHVDPRYFRELDALAEAAAMPREEIYLANFFPELFHCSGFALFGKATRDGRLYHGRILDYLRGVGLEQNAVVMVFQPDYGHAWVNVGYAGFIGSVTAMNEKQVAIGEMGGRGEGQWDGKPMAQLVREVMEKADTLDEAVEIMRSSPRTCEYFYVISDGKTREAVGIAATPTHFETIKPGQFHPRLPHPFEDTVLMSADERYLTLVERVKADYGRFDAALARDLMRRPVAMKSNIHCALFAPETLDFWVANADSEHVASHARYTHYNLRELLNASPSAPAPGPGKVAAR